MTALNEYQRLETFGLWHASPRDQRRDVIVQLGEATLTISDTRMQALSHWSLPAVERLNPGEMPACFGPGPEISEVLELEDDTMIAAIERVHAAVTKRHRKPGRLRLWMLAGVMAVLALGVMLWLPGALVRQALDVVPWAKRVELGEALLADISRVGGLPCDGALGARALERMRVRLLPDGRNRLVVLRDGVSRSAHLPGGIILLGRPLVEQTDDPMIPAGHVLAEAEAAAEYDPLRRLLEDEGMFTSLRLLATGTVSEDALRDHAEHVLTTDTRPPDIALLKRFTEARVPSTPYAEELVASGAATQAEVADLIARDPIPPGGARRVLTDGDWVSLQSICLE